MGRIAVHEFISLDGVFEDPAWTFDYSPWDPRMEDMVGGITAGSDAILLGRITFEMFAPAWSTRTVEDDPGAPFFNNTQKYVVGSRPSTVEWANSTHLGPYDAEAIRRLKESTEGIYISGSGRLVRSLLRDGLIDDLHLFVYPVVLGRGKRLWADGVDQTRLQVKDSTVYNNGVVHLNYGPA